LGNSVAEPLKRTGKKAIIELLNRHRNNPDVILTRLHKTLQNISERDIFQFVKHLKFKFCYSVC